MLKKSNLKKINHFIYINLKNLKKESESQMIQKHYKKRIVCFLTHILFVKNNFFYFYMSRVNIYSNILEVLSFSYNNNILTFNGGSLIYVSNRKYEILVSTTYENMEFTQKIQIKIENLIESPLVLIEYFKNFL